MTLWKARTGSHSHAGFAAFSSSVVEDAAFVKHDVAGSIAHVKGLHHAGLIDVAETQELIDGLNNLCAQFDAGTWQLDPALEDVHMNIEVALTKRLGDVGHKLHTGRSRNDQVATAIVLYAREHFHALSSKLLALASALQQNAGHHAATPWVAKTHGQPAQPATIGYLLAAHAWRILDVAQTALATARQYSVSPLGSGAIAGSTLPLDPAFTASELGLAAPRNALLSTGTRDVVLAAMHGTTKAAIAISGLMEDLFQLVSAGCARTDPSLMTGSSLMPQKCNPDAIELVRGHARSLPGMEAAAIHLCLPLGLGYVRDFQATKPLLLQATATAETCLDMATDIVAGLQFDVVTLTASMAVPGIGATDAAEALVAHGLPFRQAYNLLAAAHASDDPAAFLATADLAPAPMQACLDALAGDVTKRSTLGGPAPATVTASLEQMSAVIVALKAQADGLQSTMTPVEMVA